MTIQVSSCAFANFEAGRFQLRHGDSDDARKRFERALSFKPDLPTLLEWHIIACGQSSRYAEAIPSAEKLVKVLPEGWTFATLGQLYYNTDQKQQAIAALKRSLQFEHVETVQELMERAQLMYQVNCLDFAEGFSILAFRGRFITGNPPPKDELPVVC